NERHRSNVAHAIAEEKSWPRYGACCQEEPINLFWKMLTIGIEKDHPPGFLIEAALKSCLDRIPFATVLIVNNNVSAGLACTLSGLIARAVINHEDVIEVIKGPTNDIPDMFFVLIRRNDCRGLRTYIGLCHVERSRDISNSESRDSSTSLGMTNKYNRKRRCGGLLRVRYGRTTG